MGQINFQANNYTQNDECNAPVYRKCSENVVTGVVSHGVWDMALRAERN